MRQVRVHLRSTSPVLLDKYIQEKRGPDESPWDYEERIWRKRVYMNDEGFVILPARHFKRAFEEAARVQRIREGVIVAQPLVLPYKADAVRGVWMGCCGLVR